MNRRLLSNPICRICKVELFLKVNWTPSSYRDNRRRCRKCTDDYRRLWRSREGNRECDRKYARKANKSVRGRFQIAKSNAKQRDTRWEITKEEYAILISQVCHYCSYPLNQTGSGLDQIIPGLGYFKKNVVPCCHECNTAKHDHFTYEEMLILGKSIKIIKDSRRKEEC